VDGRVDLPDDVDEEAAVDALGEGVANVPALVRVEGGHLEEKVSLSKNPVPVQDDWKQPWLEKNLQGNIM
jgi:hypothetical protein